MQASGIMTRKVVSVGFETLLSEVARVFLAHGISTVPAFDPAGTSAGIVSEGGLMRRNDEERGAIGGSRS